MGPETWPVSNKSIGNVAGPSLLCGDPRVMMRHAPHKLLVDLFIDMREPLFGLDGAGFHAPQIGFQLLDLIFRASKLHGKSMRRSHGARGVFFSEGGRFCKKRNDRAAYHLARVISLGLGPRCEWDYAGAFG